jgi:CheY-like chemotaxis protein
MSSLDATILIVEDDDDLREGMVSVLRNAGWSAVGARDGIEALHQLLGGLLPCAIVLDLDMPLLNGAAFRREQLRESDWAKIPVLVCTGDCNAIAHRVLPGIAQWLKKPVSGTTLADAVSAYKLPS